MNRYAALILLIMFCAMVFVNENEIYELDWWIIFAPFWLPLVFAILFIIVGFTLCVWRGLMKYYNFRNEFEDGEEVDKEVQVRFIKKKDKTLET